MPDTNDRCSQLRKLHARIQEELRQLKEEEREEEATGVANQSRVIPARLLGHRAETGGAVEVLLLAERPDLGADCWETLVRPGRRLHEEARLVFGDEANGEGELLHAEILQRTEAGGRIVRFWVGTNE